MKYHVEETTAIQPNNQDGFYLAKISDHRVHAASPQIIISVENRFF